ncbi:MAG: hypothetical protein II672_06085, partial [Oscillospiraceae bacterium]|nr:hypothetical protein [Oscillospiraceae bacterium]
TGLAQSWGDLLGFLKTLPDSVYLCQYMKSIFPWVPRTESQTEPAVPAEPDADALLKYFEPYWKEKDEMYGRSAGVEFGLISPAGKTAVCGQVPAEGSEHRTLDEHFFPNDAVRAYREI